MRKGFYRFGERDFETIPAWQVQEGDEIAWGHGSPSSLYGAIPIESVTAPQDSDEMLLQYELPTGAVAESSPRIHLAVFWERGERPLIQVDQTISKRARVMIRRI